MQECGEGQGEAGIGREKIENEHRVVPEVSLGLRRLALEQPFHWQERRQDGGDQTCLEGQVHGVRAAGMHEHSPQLLGDPLGGDALDLPGHGPQGRAGGRLDLELKPRRQTDGAQAAQLVFAQPCRRVADGSQDVVLQVGLAPDEVDHFTGDWVHEHAVDREVAASGVELGRAEDDRLRAPAVDVGAVAAKSRDLDFDALAMLVAHAHDAE